MKQLIALAAASLAATSVANAALVDLTKRDTTGGTQLSGFNGGTITYFDGVPEPQGNNPLYVRVGNIIVSILGDPTATNAAQNAPNQCAAVTGLACDTDGLGIGDDEISNGMRVNQAESVTLEFFNLDGTARAVSINDLLYLDLFRDPNIDQPNLTPDDIETAIATFSNAGGQIGTNVTEGTTGTRTTIGFEKASDQALGVVVAGVTKVVFTAGSGTDDGTGDYALAAVDFTAMPNVGDPIPVPAALPLFLAGLGGFAAFRRRAR